MKFVIGCTPVQVATTIMRLIKRRFPAADCTIVENGAELMFVLQKQHVDICFIDLSLSVVSAEEIMTAISYSSGLDKIKKVLVCTIQQQQLLRRLSVMGISGFLVKPLNIEQATELVDRLVYATKELYMKHLVVPFIYAPREKEPVFADNSVMLIADEDEEFRNFVQALFAPTLRAVAVHNGAEALYYYMQNRQVRIILLGEDQKLLHENAVAQKIKSVATGTPPALFLCKEPGNNLPFDRDFKGILDRTTDMAAFLAKYIEVVLRSTDKYMKLLEILRPHVLKECYAKLQQSYLEKTEMNIYIIDRPFDIQTHTMMAEYVFTSTVHSRVLMIAICMPRDKMLALADDIAKKSVGSFEGAKEYISGLLQPVAEAAMEYLNGAGMEYSSKEFELSEALTARELLLDWTYLMQTDRAERFLLRIMVKDGLTTFFVG